MKRKLKQFPELNISQNNFEKKVAVVRKKCENFAITLHKEQVMDDNLQHQTTKLKTAGCQYYKVKGPKAKNFAISHRHISILCLKPTSLNRNFWNP